MKNILIFVLVSLVGSIIADVAFDFFALKKLESLMWTSHINVKTTGEFLKPIFIYITIFSLIFVSILFILVAIRMIRKTSGPLYRMANDIMKVTDGNLSIKITLRQKDEFKDVANELNNMLRELRERFKIINDRYIEISRSIGRLKDKAGMREPTIKNCNSILSGLEDLEKELYGFKNREG
jgi:methyl-accepting chemotaxis protein